MQLMSCVSQDQSGLQPISIQSPKSLGCPRITKRDDCMTSVVLPVAILIDILAERLCVRHVFELYLMFIYWYLCITERYYRPAVLLVTCALLSSLLLCYFLCKEVLWSGVFVGWVVCDACCNFPKSTSSVFINLAHMSSIFAKCHCYKVKFICFMRDLSAVAMTKRKQVHAQSVSSYLRWVIVLAEFEFKLNHSVSLLYVSGVVVHPVHRRRFAQLRSVGSF